MLLFRLRFHAAFAAIATLFLLLAISGCSSAVPVESSGTGASQSLAPEERSLITSYQDIPDNENTSLPQENIPTPQSEPDWTVTEASCEIYCTGSSVNIRNAPSTEGGIVGSVARGDSLECTGKVDNGWLRVRYKETDCYVSGQYFSTEKPAAAEKPDPPVTDISSSASPGTGIYYEGNGPLVAIDAGHQAQGDNAKEPIGPGSDITKAKVTYGSVGVSTGVPEYQLTLDISLQLRDVLLEKGYSVLMIRETNNVSISNAERAQLANKYGADIFLRIHANSVDVSSATGTLTMAPSLDNPYCSGIAKDSQILSQLLVDSLCAKTGFRNRGVSITDTMTGINWCEMPVSIIEMGFMSNEKEDQAMQTPQVQQQLVDGMVEAIEQYFSR